MQGGVGNPGLHVVFSRLEGHTASRESGKRPIIASSAARDMPPPRGASPPAAAWNSTGVIA
jgi:hypothetical protein